MCVCVVVAAADVALGLLAIHSLLTKREH